MGKRKRRARTTASIPRIRTKHPHPWLLVGRRGRQLLMTYHLFLKQEIWWTAFWTSMVQALVEISSPKSDMEAEKNIQDAKVATDAMDTATPIQPPQSKVRPLRKGSSSN
jgi:hypothetical protein